VVYKLDSAATAKNDLILSPIIRILAHHDRFRLPVPITFTIMSAPFRLSELLSTGRYVTVPQGQADAADSDGGNLPASVQQAPPRPLAPLTQACWPLIWKVGMC
jgi:hypothetical protein